MWQSADIQSSLSGGCVLLRLRTEEGRGLSRALVRNLSCKVSATAAWKYFAGPWVLGELHPTLVQISGTITNIGTEPLDNLVLGATAGGNWWDLPLVKPLTSVAFEFVGVFGIGAPKNRGAKSKMARTCNFIVLLGLITASLLAGCSSECSLGGQSFEPCSELRPWSAAGFSSEEAPAWQSTGLTPEEAVAWRQAGFTAKEAAAWSNRPWSNRQFSLEDAIKWRQYKIDPDEAADYRTAFGAITPQDVQMLRAAGMTIPKECSDHKLSYKEALEWRMHGFSCADASPWKEAGATAKQAVRWKSAGLGTDTHYLAKQGISSQTAKAWQAAGITLSNKRQVSAVREYLAKGYDLKQAVYYTSHGIEPDQVGEYERMKSICHDSYHDVAELFYLSPFASNGKCFQILTVIIQQWLVPTVGLGSTGIGLVLVDFDQAPTNQIIVAGIFLGEGAYQYESVIGSFQTVPRLKWVTQWAGSLPLTRPSEYIRRLY